MMSEILAEMERTREAARLGYLYYVSCQGTDQPGPGIIIMFIIGGAGIVILDQDFCSVIRDLSSGESEAIKKKYKRKWMRDREK